MEAAGLGARVIGFDISVELESEFKVGMTGGTVGGVGAVSPANVGLAVGVRVSREAAVGTVAMATSVGGFADTGVNAVVAEAVRRSLGGSISEGGLACWVTRQV